jgi:hypothetical protein
MASALGGIKQEWRRFRDDPPGQRFRNHNERVSHQSPVLVAARLVAGLVLVAIGIVLLFIPGPGTILIAFGLGVLAGRSKRLAGWLDRAEPVVRRWLDSARRRWKRLPRIAHVAIVVGALAAAGGAAYLAWSLI